MQNLVSDTSSKTGPSHTHTSPCEIHISFEKKLDRITGFTHTHTQKHVNSIVYSSRTGIVWSSFPKQDDQLPVKALNVTTSWLIPIWTAFNSK